MKLVIDIDEEYYEIVKHLVNVEHSDFKPYKIIANSTPLPKGHGRLIDASNLLTVTEYNGEYERTYVLDVDIDNAPTIIEADKAESEE